MQIEYVPKKFSSRLLEVVQQASDILEEYHDQGFDMTVRALYYKFVARNLFPDDRRWRQVPNTKKWVRDPNGTRNAPPNYKWLGGIVNDARLAGLIDWDFLIDRTRSITEWQTWDSPQEAVQSVVDSYSIDRWADQHIGRRFGLRRMHWWE